MSSFDVCIMGTGLKHSILAAALAKAGQKVLHIDRNSFYGDREGTAAGYDNIPQVMYANGDLIQLLVQSDICRYLEFHLVSNILMLGVDIYRVPVTKEDIFTDDKMSPMDKRRAMKLMEKIQLYTRLSLDDMVKEVGVDNSQMVQALSSAVFMQSSSQPVTEKIVSRTEKFLSSVGKYGKSPFMYPLYGIAELPQAFCRFCAVNGGVYVLGCSEVSLTGEDLQLTVDGQQHTFLVENYIEESRELSRVFRAVYWLDNMPLFFEGQDLEEHSIIFVEEGVQALLTSSNAQTAASGSIMLSLWTSIDISLDSVASRILANAKNDVKVLNAKQFEAYTVQTDTLFLDEIVQEARQQFQDICKKLDIQAQFFE